MVKTTILFTFITALALIGHSQTKTSIQFEWSNDSLNGVLFEKTSMHIPVKFSNDTTSYYFQFDTGSNASFIYSGNAISNEFINSLTKNEGVESDIGKIHFQTTSSNENYKENGRIHIGTIGTDFLEGKKIEIDFKNQSITFLDVYDNSEYLLTPMLTSYGRPVITLESQNREYNFLFDTGSSLFELWTTKKLWEKWKVPDAKIEGYPISSWGKMNTAYKTNLNINLKFPLCHAIIFKTIWYNSNKKFDKEFKKMNISGIVGNKSFLDHVIFIDFENKMIGIKNCI